MRVLDRNTNEVIDLASADNPDAVIPGIFSGELSPDLDAVYKLKLPNGQISDTPGANLEAALKAGASFYGKNDLLKDQETEKFDSIPQQVAAGGLGAARGLSLGLSDLVLTKSGLVSPEYLQKQEEYNPNIGTAGEVAGAIAPAILSSGSSTAANILSKTPAGLVSALGSEATSLGANAASKIIPKTFSPLVQNVVTKAAEMGIGSAAEGALYGGGKAVSESAIQNKPLTAEAVLANGGYGALIGGLTGGALGAGVEVAGAGAKKVLDKISDLVGNSKDLESRLVVRGLGANKKQMGAILGNDFKQEVINDAYKAIVNGIDNTGQGFKKAFDESKQKTLGLDSIKISNDELASGVNKLKTKAGETIENSLDQVQSMTDSKDFLMQMDAARNNLNRLDFAGKDRVNAYLDKLKQEFSTIDEAGNVSYMDMTAKDLWNVRKDLDSVIYQSKDLTPLGRADNSFTETLARGRQNVEKRLEEMLETTGGDVYSEYKAAKKAYAGAIDIEKLIDHQNAKAANNLFGLTSYDAGAAGAVIGGAPGAAIGFLGRKAIADYGDKAALYILSNLEKRAGTLSKTVDESINGLMSAARKSGTVSTITTGGDKNKSYESKIKELDLQQQRIEEIKNHINETLGGMSAAAPETALQLRDKTLNAMDFLSSKLPKKPEVNPLIQYQVPESEIDKFNRYATAVENPNTILKNLKGGYISPEEVEVLKKVYPEIHLKLKNKALDLLSTQNKSKSLNYQLRLQLQKLLDTKADVSLYSTSIKTLQKSFQPPQQNQQQTVYPAKLPGSRARGLDLGNSASSGFESTLRRRNS
jgi:hypothetical protein